MKKIFKYISILAAAAFVPAVAGAQSKGEPGYAPDGVVINKTVTEVPGVVGQYNVTLESYTTGVTTTTVSEVNVPMDIVLLLDVSGSMNDKVKGVTKIKLLQDAVNDFIDVVYKKSTEDSKGNLLSSPVDNRISIVKFADDSYGYSGSGWSRRELTVNDIEERNDRDGNNYNYTQVYKRNVAVSDETVKNALKTSVNDLKAGGATAADYGFNKAEKVFDYMRLTNGQYAKDSNGDIIVQDGEQVERPRILVFFTDGEPNHSSGFSNSVASSVVNKSQEFKSVGIKVFSVGALSNPGDAVKKYLEYTSSNYPDATASVNGNNLNYTTGTKTGSDYYQLTDGADLSSIFRAIAQSATSGGATYTLEATTTTVVDVVSQYFEIPEGTKASDIKIYTAVANGGNASSGFTFAKEEAATGMTPVIDGKQVSVTGFDFSENYVSYDATLNKYTGKKLIIEFPVVMKSDNPGGTAQFTNDLESGIFVKKDGKLEQVAWFQRPTVDLPNILIKKDGLMKGESAIFTISGRSADGRELNVQAIATCYADGDPAYARVVLQKNGTYTVTEMTAWTWSRDVELVGTYAKGTATVNKDNASITRTLGADTEQEDGKYKGTLFHFKNPAKSGQPAHAEAVVTNTFGQNGATASAVTTNND